MAPEHGALRRDESRGVRSLLPDLPPGRLVRNRWRQLKGCTISERGPEYDYVSGPVLLRVSQYLTPTQAKGYQHALAKLKT